MPAPAHEDALTTVYTANVEFDRAGWWGVAVDVTVDGETYREAGAIVPGEGKRFQSLNRGKRSITLDLKHPDATALVHRIIDDADVLLTNYRPGVPERLRIDYATLSAINPRLIAR